MSGPEHERLNTGATALIGILYHNNTSRLIGIGRRKENRERGEKGGYQKMPQIKKIRIKVKRQSFRSVPVS